MTSQRVKDACKACNKLSPYTIGHLPRLLNNDYSSFASLDAMIKDYANRVMSHMWTKPNYTSTGYDGCYADLLQAIDGMRKICDQAKRKRQ